MTVFNNVIIVNIEILESEKVQLSIILFLFISII